MSLAAKLVGKHHFPLSLVLLWVFIVALRRQRAALPVCGKWIC